MSKVKIILLFLLLLIVPIKSFAFSDDIVSNSYFFQNNETGEIKYIHNEADVYIGKFDESIIKHLDGKEINNPSLFNYYKLIAVQFCINNKCNYTNSGIYISNIYTRDDYYKKNADLIFSGSYLNNSGIYISNINTRDNYHQSSSEINKFTENDLNKIEKILIYYKFVITNYILEFLFWLPFNLIVFYLLRDFINKNLIKRFFKIKKNVNTFIISLMLYMISDILLYLNGFGYSQFTNGFADIIYFIYIGIEKILLFILGILYLFLYKENDPINNLQIEKTPE